MTKKPRICIHCNEEYILRDHRANRRRFCYKPQCVERNKKYAYQKRKELTSEWRKRPKPKPSDRLCHICNRPLNEDRYYNHDACVEQYSERVDGDYLFCVEGETIF